MYRLILGWLIGCGLMGTVQAQNALRFEVSLPINGAVYQQSNNGTGEIFVTGTINSLSFRNGVRNVPAAQLRKLDRLTGTILSGSPINVPLSRVSQSTFFYGTVTVPKGWYQLTVSQAGVASVTRKVGVGEVFVIAGQSNAQGFCKIGDPNQAANTRLLDAVRVSPNVITELENKSPNDDNDFFMPGSYRRITELKSTAETAVIGPNGQCRWYWASAAAQLSDALDAPVALFNTAYSGTTITNWVTSTQADNRTSGGGGTPDGTDLRYAPGSPFFFFANTLQIFTNIYGVRAVLWMQGETDNKAILQTNDLVPNPGGDYTRDWTDRIVVNSAGLPVASNSVPLGDGNREKRNVITTDNYRNKLAYLINKSREFVYNPDNQKIPWVVAKASLILGQTNTTITDGQTASLLGDVVLQGPNLDNIGANRRYGAGTDEPVHFVNDALDDVATLWANVLKDMCLNNRVIPFTVQRQGTVPLINSISQDGTLAEAPSGYQWRWVRDDGSFDVNAPVANSQGLRVSGGNPSGYTQSVTNAPSPGTYRAVLQNSNGQFILTPSVRLPYTLVNDTNCNLNIGATVSNANPGCGGGISLNAFCDTGDCNGISYAWSGNGFSSNQQNPSLNAPSSNGQFTYTVLATRNGCSTSGSVNINVSGCTPTGGGLTVLTPPGYTCNGSEGQLTVQTSGGNGSTIEYRVPGLRDWGNSPNFTVPSYQRDGTSFTMYARQSGQEVQNTFTTTCSGTPPTPGCFSLNPSASNGNPGCNQAVTLNANCGSGDCSGVNYAWSGNGLNGGGSSIAVTPPASNGSYIYSVSASKNGCTPQTGTVTVTVSGCGVGSFALNQPTINCGNGNVALSVVNSNGSTVEYQAIGLRGWGTDNVFTVPTYQRNGFSFTFQARQSGTEVSQSLTTNCAGYRIGINTAETAEDTDTDTGLVISPNPSSGRVSVQFRLAAGERGSLSVQSLTGAVLQSRAVVGTGATQTEVLDMEREPAGLYLIRVSATGKSQTGRATSGRVLLMR